MSEQFAEKIYDEVLDKLIYPMVGKKITFSDDLKKAGCRLFGRKFMGVFASDQLPNLDVDNRYAIFNLDSTDEPGSHWIAAAFDPKKNKIFIYDSFGRDTKKIIPSVINKYGKRNVIDADDDAEQGVFEEDCGGRSLAFLYVFDKYGSDLAQKI